MPHRGRWGERGGRRVAGGGAAGGGGEGGGGGEEGGEGAGEGGGRRGHAHPSPFESILRNRSITRARLAAMPFFTHPSMYSAEARKMV